MGRTENRPKDYERAVVVEHEMKETKEDHSLEWREKSVQKHLTGPTLLEMP
jgi:hypothetical protein